MATIDTQYLLALQALIMKFGMEAAKNGDDRLLEEYQELLKKFGKVTQSDN